MRNCIRDCAYELRNNYVFQLYMFDIVFTSIYKNIDLYAITSKSSIIFMDIK